MNYQLLAPLLRGDHWEGLEFIPDGDVPPAALSAVRMDFRLEPGDAAVGVTLSTGNAKIVISDSAGWVFAIPVVALGLAVGNWFSDVQTTDEDGIVRTIARLILPVKQDVTRSTT